MKQVGVFVILHVAVERLATHAALVVGVVFGLEVSDVLVKN